MTSEKNLTGLLHSDEGDSGVDHTIDHVLDQDDSDEDGDEVDLKDDSEEEEKPEVKKKEVVKEEANIIEDKIDFKQLEEEILGDELVEPSTEDADETVEEQDIADRRIVGKRQDTSDMITDMLNQMVVEGSRDVAIR